MTLTYDVIVVGAGAVGSAAAYHAAKAGLRVALLEQFEIDHPHGSSYGHSRIIRYAYDHPAYVELAKSTFPAWEALSDEAGERLYIKTGGIDFGPPDEPSLLDTVRSLAASGIPHERLSPDEAQARFPQFRFNPDMLIVYQADAGILPASRCVRAFVRLARASGADVYEQSPVTAIDVTANAVTVRTASDTFSAGTAILVPGAWGKAVFGLVGLNLPLTPVKAQESYYDARPTADYEPERFPIFIAHMRDTYGFMPYGLPSNDGSGLKLGIHGGPVVDDVATMDRSPEPDVETRGRAFMRAHLPAGGDAPLIYARACLYTMTPDEHYIVDRHPLHPHVIVSSSCSGHGFKFSISVGQMLVDLARRPEASQAVDVFRLNRFENVLSYKPPTAPWAVSR